MTPRRYSILTALLSCAAALSGCSDSDPGASTVAVRSGRFTVVVSEACEFKPLRSVSMLARASGKLDWILPEGTLVKPGDLLFTQDRTSEDEWLARDSAETEAAQRNLKEVRRQVQMERDELKLGIDSKRAAVTLAATRLRSVRKGAEEQEIAKAAAALKAAETDNRNRLAAAASARKLHEQGYISAAALEKERLAASLSAISLERRKLQLEHLKAGAGKERLRIAELEYERAKVTLEMAKADALRHEAGLASRVAGAEARLASLQRSVARVKRRIAARQVRAFTSGVVIHRNMHWRHKSKPEVGSRAWAGAGVMDVADLSRMKIRTRLAERFIRYLKVGAKLRVTPDPLEGVTLEARVTWIDRWSRDRSADLAKADREKEGLSGVKVFTLEAEVLGSDTRIKPGFKGKAQFPLVTIEDALIVPLAAVFGPPGDRFVMTGGAPAARRIPVTLLADDGTEAAVRGEITPGLRLLTRDSL